MSEIYKTFDDSGLTALANYMKATRTKANSNEAAIEDLGADLAVLSEEVVNALGDKVDKTSIGALAAKDTVEKTDLASDIQASLDKADSALQSFTETDPTVPAWAKAATKPSYTYDEVGAASSDHSHDEYQEKLTFDTAPKNNSTNPVTSGGLYTALLDKQNKITGTSGQFVGFNAAGFPTAKDLTLPTGFARCAGTYDASTNRYTVELPDAMDSIPTGYAFILIPDTDNAAEDVDIYANYKTAGGQSKSAIVELRFRNMPGYTAGSIAPSGAIKKNVPLMVVKGELYWFIDSIHYHLFDSGIITAGDGAAYTATVSGIESLETGMSFIMIPHTDSTSKTATLNVNGLGDKRLRRPVSSNNATTVANSVTNWLYANRPVRVMYNGSFWVVIDMPRPNGSDIYGNIAASVISAGTFAGEVVAKSDAQTPGTSLLRNSKLVSADTDPTVNGEICWTYK